MTNKQKKSDFIILTDNFSSRPSIEMIKECIAKHTATDIEDLEYIKDQPFMIRTFEGDFVERRFTGLVSRKAAAIYPFHLKKYRSKGTRLATSRTGVTKSGEEKTYPDYEREQKGSRYVMRIYEFPLRNVRAFIQSGNENYVSFFTDSTLEYLENRLRGYPENNKGVFSLDKLDLAIKGILVYSDALKGRYHRQITRNFTALDLTTIDIRIDIKKETFTLIDGQGKVITDPTVLKCVFNPLS